MLLRIGLFALMAIGLLGFGAAAWVSTLPAAPPAAVVAAAAPPPPPPVKLSVVAVAHSMRAGSFLRSEDLRAAEMTADQVPPGAVPDSPAARSGLAGAMLRHNLAEGTPVTDPDVIKPADHGFLAAVLAPGMRAVTANLTETLGGSHLVWPGDRIDLILMEGFEDPGTFARRRFAAETVMQDVRVVAVDEQIVPGEVGDDAAHKTGHSLTVEVSPDGAERLAVALKLGKLAVSLRPLADPPAAALAVPARITWSGDVARALAQPTRPAPPATVQLFRGNAGKERS